MRICCLSDTHEMHSRIQLPKADLLVHAGDLTFRGDPEKIREFNEWCRGVVRDGLAKAVVCIAGNHDFLFQEKPAFAKSLMTACAYLEDSGTVIDGAHVYGTPWQPWFYDWAFNLRAETELKAKFDLIPARTQVLICHSPPKGILDANREGESCGSSALLEAIERVRPKLVVFGHIHEGYGVLTRDGITYVNASICTPAYDPTNAPVLIDLDL